MRLSELRSRFRQHGCRTSLTVRAVTVLGVIMTLMSAAHAQLGGLGRGVRLHDGRGVRVLQTHGQQPAGDTGSHYGIMGPVAKPGVYVTTDVELTLAELVRAAGGLTDKATTLARVIRNGRNGLQLIYSPDSVDRLMPGDVVVFDAIQARPRVSSPRNPIRVAGYETPPQSQGENEQWTIVAFVGLFPKQPIIIDLQEDTLPKVIAALRQPPELIRYVRVIRTSRSAPRIAPGQQPKTLASGDVILFSPPTIDHDALTRLTSVDPFPPAIPVSHVETDVSTANEPVLPTAELAPTPTLTLPTPAHDLAMPEPARNFEERMLPPLESQPALSPAIPVSEDRPVETTADAILATPLQFASSEPSRVVPTGLIRTRQPHREQIAVAKPQPSLARPTPAPAEPRADFAADSFDRLAMATEPMPPANRDDVAEQTGNRLAAVPTPLDLSQSSLQTGVPAASTGFGSRATTLGITVLIIAVVCFAGSLVWSRLDDSTGLAREKRITPADEQTAAAPVQDRRTLDRLIDNTLPLIEEQTILPEHVDYHGEAVGRRRIRIDARQDLQGPHGKVGSRKSERGADAAEFRRSTVATPAETTPRQTLRIDTPDSVAEESQSVGNTQQPGDESGQGGLLERVLLAMEREKRR